MATIIDSHFGESALQVEVSEGLSIEGIVRQCEIPEAIWTNVVIVLNGIEVARDEWDSVYPVQSDVISVHVVPLGGGDGKNILRLVAVVAIAVAAPALGAKLAASSFGTAVGLSKGVATGLITIVGSLAVSALIPPPTIRPNIPGGSATSNAYFLSGQSNRARPYEVCPVTYGFHKIYFNLASAPHIFNAGTSSLFQGLYDIGVGGYSVQDIKVGDTAFNLFKNRSFKLHTFAPDPYSQSSNSAFGPVDLEIYNFPIKSVDLSIGLDDVGDFGVSTTHPECHTAVLELSFPSGLAYFDDMGEAQGTGIRYYIGYRPSGGGAFQPLPQATKGFAGDDHLSFRGFTDGDGSTVGSGPTDGDGNPIYEAKIGAGPITVFEGEKSIVRVFFDNGNPGYFGDGYNSYGDPERPKESFWWERIDDNGNVLEVYQTRSTVNTDNPADWDKSQWAYNQVPDPLDGYTPVPPSYAYGTMVADDYGGLNDVAYAFEFIAPNVAGRYRLKMDMYEWWSLPYNTGGERLADSPQTFTYAKNIQGNPLILDVTAEVVAQPGESFNDQDQNNYSHTFGGARSFDSADGPWQPVSPGNEGKIIIWWKGTYYDYSNINQTTYIFDTIAGTLMKVINVERQFSQWVGQGYFAIKDAAIQGLINQGILYPLPEYDIRSVNNEVSPSFITINDDWFDDTFPEGTVEDANGTYFWVYGSEATPGVISLVVPMPSVGSYDFRIERVEDGKSQTQNQTGEPADANRLIDQSVWSRIGSRGINQDNAVLNLQHRHTLFECEFEANQAVQGNVQEINALVKPYIRSLRSNGAFYGPGLYDVNGKTAYDNPAYVVLDILTGWTIQNRRAPRWLNDHCGWLHPDQLDLGSFYSFAQHCNETVEYQTVTGTAFRKRYTTNMVMASDAPIIETCQNILGQCRAQLIITQAGKIGVMLDEYRTTPRQLFTPSNSWEFSGSRSFTEIPHAFNVQFISPDLGWQQATVVVYRPGYDATGSGANDVATLFEDLDTVGITNPHQAQLYGAYMLAQAIVRNEIFTLNVDTENLVCQRGDLVQVAHDAPLTGGRSCVITGEEGGWLNVSERFGPLDSDNNRYTLRTDDGQIISGSVSAIDDDRIKISNQYQAEVGNLIVIGAQNLVTEDYLIQSIRPKPDMTAELSLVKYDERVYQVDQGIYPIWSPNFSQNDLSGGTHTVFNLSGSSSLIYKDRQPYTKAVLNWGVYPDDDTLAGFYIEWQRQGATNRESLAYLASGTRTFTHEYSSRSSTYGTGTYFVIPYSSLGYRGREAGRTLSKRVDTTPPVVDSFTAEFTASGNTLLTWACDDIDIQGFTIYYKASATLPLGKGEVIGVPAYHKREWLIEGAKEGMFWIVATDTSGNNSDPAKDGSFSEGAYPTPSLVEPFYIRISGNIKNGELYWEPLIGEKIDYYVIEIDKNGVVEPFRTVDHFDRDYETLFLDDPYEADYLISAVNIFGVQGPKNRARGDEYPRPSIVEPFDVRLAEDRNSGELIWEPLVNEAIDYYSLYRSAGLVPSPDEADFMANVSHLDIGEMVYPLADPYGRFFITATNIFGITGPPNATVEFYPTPGAVQNFRLWVEQGLGVLKWDLLDDPTITVYELRYSENQDETNAEDAAPYGSTDGNTNAYPSEKLEGSFFIRAKNRWGVFGPWTRTTSTFEGLGIVDAGLTQKLRFIGRYPFSDVTLKWRVTGDQSLISRYRVYFYPTDPVMANTFKEGELVAERPPVLVYEGQERECLTTVSTTEDTGRQHGVFIIQVISIYGTPGDEASLDFQVIKDVVAPMVPERFFVNILNNTNADLSWLASQSIDVDTYDLRYTPELSSPRWEASEHIATVGWNVTGYQTNARTGTYLIRATDTSGNVSDVVKQRTTVADLPDMNVIERVEDAPDWLGKKVYFAVDGSRLLMDNAPYTGGDEFGAEPYREAFYYYHERLDLGRIYETRLTAKLQAYGQLEGSVMADWPTLAEIDPISGVKESADWDCWVEYRTGTEEDVIADWVNMVDQDPISGSIASDWTDWRAFFAADVTARFIDFRIVARAYNPNAEVGVISGLVEVDMPDRYWTKSDIPVGVAGASVSIDPPFKHLEAVAVTVDGNDYNVRAVVSDKKPSGFDVKLIDQTNGQAVAGQIDVFCSGYGIEAPEII